MYSSHIRPYARRVFRDWNALPCKQAGLCIQPARIPGQAAVCPDNTVAGYDDRDRVVPDSAAHRLRGHPALAVLFGQLVGKCTVGRSFAVGDLQQQRPYFLPKVRPDRMERRRKSGTLPLK